MNTRITQLLLFLLFAGIASAQSSVQSIRGSVFQTDGEPAVYATVTLQNALDSSLVKAGFTFEDGTFELMGFEAGSYYLSVSYVGYAIYHSETFQLSPSELKEIPPIKLLNGSTELEEVVVKARKPIVEVKPGKTVFNVEKSINSTGNTALELLRKSPGVVEDNNENILIAG